MAYEHGADAVQALEEAARGGPGGLVHGYDASARTVTIPGLGQSIQLGERRERADAGHRGERRERRRGD